jgi:hypothetical protein
VGGTSVFDVGFSAVQDFVRVRVSPSPRESRFPRSGSGSVLGLCSAVGGIGGRGPDWAGSTAGGGVGWCRCGEEVEGGRALGVGADSSINCRGFLGIGGTTSATLRCGLVGT